MGQGVIFDPEDQPDILTPLSHNGASRDEHSKNCGPFIPEQESPLQRPRPPERLQPPPRKRSFQNRWSQRLSSAVIINRNPNNFTNQRLTPLFFCAMPKGPRFSEKDWHYLQAQTDTLFSLIVAAATILF